MARSFRPLTAAAPASASIRSRRSRSISSIRARRRFPSARPAATWAASFARTGPARGAATSRPPAKQAQPQAIAATAKRLGMPERGLHLQRSDHLGRICHRHRASLPRVGRQDRGGHVGLHHGRRPAGLLRVDGRGQRRSEGVHRGVLSRLLRRPFAAGARHAPLAGPRKHGLAGDHQPDYSRGQRFAR